jgi:predicted amidohydrolase
MRIRMSRLKVAAVQTAPEFGRVETNTETALAMIPAQVDLAVLPELFNTGYQFRDREEADTLCESIPDGPTCRRLQAFAAANKTVIVAGLAERHDDRLFNSSVMVHPDGRIDVYRKVHLFWDEKLIFTPGDLGFPLQTVGDIPAGMMVCFDWIFPESARTLALAGAQLVCHPSNLVLPYCPEAMITRSLENRIFTITTNRTGVEERIPGQRLEFIGSSQIVSPSGERLASLDRTETGACTAEIDIVETSKTLTPRNDLWEDRRPETYTL